MHVKIDLKIFAFIILFCLTRQFAIYALLMLFAILHEIGHLVAGLLLKLKPKKMELTPFGLSITFEGIGAEFKNNIPQKRIIIALAGPLVNFLLILLAYILPLGANQMTFIYANLILILVNLIPLYPLDGGRVLKNILHMKVGYFEACKITNQVSNIITVMLTVAASLTIFYFENIAILLIIIYLWILRFQENKRFNLIKNTYTLIENDNITLEKI